MGGPGSGYNLPLKLTREMKIALTKLTAQESSPKDFLIGLKIFRAGLIAYQVLPLSDLGKMYHRKLIQDDEIQFLLESGLIKEDPRPVPIERIHQAEEIKILNQQFKDVFECWTGLKESSKIAWIKKASQYPDLPGANQVMSLIDKRKLKVEK